MVDNETLAVAIPATSRRLQDNTNARKIANSSNAPRCPAATPKSVDIMFNM